MPSKIVDFLYKVRNHSAMFIPLFSITGYIAIMAYPIPESPDKKEDTIIKLMK